MDKYILKWEKKIIMRCIHLLSKCGDIFYSVINLESSHSVRLRKKKVWATSKLFTVL